jgi:hypothetical protein
MITDSMLPSPPKKSPVAHILKNLPIFYGTLRFMTVLKEAATGPYPEPDKSNPYHQVLFLYIPYFGIIKVGL